MTPGRRQLSGIEKNRKRIKKESEKNTHVMSKVGQRSGMIIE